jgi:ribosome-associated toxin RatA of RatAB toxin-antitoxin module
VGTKIWSTSISREVRAGLDRVWNIVADVDNEPYFWPGLNTVNNISKYGNTIERKVTVGFKSSKSCQQTVVLYPRKSIDVSMTKGPIRGLRSVTLNSSSRDNNKTRIDVSCNIDLSNMPISDRIFTRNNIVKETAEALNRIVEMTNKNYGIYSRRS